MITTKYTTTKQLNKNCKCCNAYLRMFKRYSLTDSALNFNCLNCGNKISLLATIQEDKDIIEIGVY